MKKDKKPYNPAAYPLFGIRLSPHPLQFIVMSHLRVQFVLHLFKEVGATVAFPAFDVRIEAVAVFGKRNRGQGQALSAKPCRH